MFPRHRLDIGAADLWFGLRATVGRTDAGPGGGRAAAVRRDRGPRPGVPVGPVGLGPAAGGARPGRRTARCSCRPSPTRAWSRSCGRTDCVRCRWTSTRTPSLRRSRRSRPPAPSGPVVCWSPTCSAAGSISRRCRRVARRHGLLLVEDSAQAFAGPSSLVASGADVSLFSFGLIKTASAAGGAVVTVADAGLLARLRAAHRRWPRQTSALVRGQAGQRPRPWSSSTTPAGSSCCSGRAGWPASTWTA